MVCQGVLNQGQNKCLVMLTSNGSIYKRMYHHLAKLFSITVSLDKVATKVHKTMVIKLLVSQIRPHYFRSKVKPIM